MSLVVLYIAIPKLRDDKNPRMTLNLEGWNIPIGSFLYYVAVSNKMTDRK